MDFPDELLAELDVCLGAIHSRYKQDREAMTRRIVRGLENPWVNILVHPTGRLIGSRDPYDVDLDAVFAAAKAHGKALEINCSTDRLDLNDVHARRAAEMGIPLAISTDTHYLSNFDTLELGVAVARRAWVGPEQVLNTRPLPELLRWARPDRSA
jgi:DNA polymerase (family 10)